MAKNKTFVLSDDSLNSYGFRTLTAGIDIEQFKKNPVMLFMHNRPQMGLKEEYSVIGRWENIRKENGQLLADAVFDQNDAFAKSIGDKVANDFIRMASLGFNPVETSCAEEHILPGQKFETVTKSLAKEASIVDIGANNNALALCDVPAIYDEHDVEIKLSAGKNSVLPLIQNSKNNNMELKDLLPLLKLADGATMQDAVAAVTAQNNDMVQLRNDNKRLGDELTVLKAAADAEKINSLVNGAESAKKITAAEKPHYLKLATADFESTKAVLDGMKAYESIEKKLTDDEAAVNQVELGQLIALSGETLFNEGKLERLKQLSPVHYRLKYKEAFEKEPAEDKK